jgi:hypothetical protein
MTTSNERDELTEPLASVLIAAALLTFARIVKAGAAMDAEIQATI